jgi:hypothetical protein
MTMCGAALSAESAASLANRTSTTLTVLESLVNVTSPAARENAVTLAATSVLTVVSAVVRGHAPCDEALSDDPLASLACRSALS